jgi:hypothetical protein
MAKNLKAVQVKGNIHCVCHVHTVGQCSALKGKLLAIHTTVWGDLQRITPNGKGQSPKVTQCLIPLYNTVEVTIIGLQSSGFRN